MIKFQLIVDTHQAKMGLLMDETCETSTYIARLSGRHVASERMLCIPVKRVFDSFMFFYLIRHVQSTQKLYS